MAVETSIPKTSNAPRPQKLGLSLGRALKPLEFAKEERKKEKKKEEKKRRRRKKSLERRPAFYTCSTRPLNANTHKAFATQPSRLTAMAF